MPRVATTRREPYFPPGNYFGIDPGVSGGLSVVIVRPDVPDVVRAIPMPDNKRDIYIWLTQNKATKFPNTVIFEKVGGFIASTWGAGKKNMGTGHTMFTFGKMTGWIDMALEVVGFDDVREIIPRVWQAGCSLPPRRSEREGRKVTWLETTSQFKGRLKAEAERIFNGSKVTLKISDALLMAHYGRLLRREELEGNNGGKVGTSLHQVG